MSWKRTKCVVTGCCANKENFPDRKFHRFPKKNSDMYAIWCKAVKSGVTSRKCPYICSHHFGADDYAKSFLKRNAFPRFHLDSTYDSNTLEGDKTQQVVNTYKRPSQNDLTFDELDVLSKVNHTPSSEETFEVTCSKCLKCHQQVKLCCRKLKRVQEENRKLRAQLERIKKNQKNLRKRTNAHNECKKKLLVKACETLENKIDTITCVNDTSKIFAKLITSTDNTRTYSEDEKWICQCLYFRSSAGYNFLRNFLGFHLPHPSSLHRWINIKNLSAGPSKPVLEEIEKEVKNLSKIENEVVLIFDEMSVQANLTYDKSKDKIVGFVDYGDDNATNTIAKSVCVFMVRSLFGKFKQALYYIPCASNIPAENLLVQVLKCLDICKNLGLKVRAICCDQGPTNRKFYNTLNVSLLHPYFLNQGNKIFTLFDYPHLFKSIRNRILANNLITPDGTISWSIIAHLYNMEIHNTTKVCPKLTHAHIFPTNFQKMNVKLAVQVLSESVAVGIETAYRMNKFPDNLKKCALPTALFLRKMNRLFDVLNGKTPLMRTERDIGFLEEMKAYVLEIKPVGVIDKAACFKGLAMTIEGILKLRQTLFLENDQLSFFHTNKTNQDPLENLFGQIKSRNGNKTNPSVYEFGCLFAKILSIKFLFKSKFANCEDDEDEALQVDWSAVLQKSSEESVIILEPERLPLVDLTDTINNIENCCESEPLIDDESRVSVTVPDFTDISTRYFAGYCYFKAMKNMVEPCEICQQSLCRTDKTFSASEILIKLKAYESSDGRPVLIWPSEQYFQVCKLHVSIFKKYFDSCPSLSYVRRNIVQRCITITNLYFNDWFQQGNSCSTHRLNILDSLITILLWKHCKWFLDENLKRKGFQAKRNHKMLKITNM